MMHTFKSFMRNITGSQITCFVTSTFKQYLLTINHYKDWSFDRKGNVQFSDENKILMDKSMFERYRKCKCCVFIDFEYMMCLFVCIKWKFRYIVIYHSTHRRLSKYTTKQNNTKMNETNNNVCKQTYTTDDLQVHTTMFTTSTTL